jgi:hypothetical protein
MRTICDPYKGFEIHRVWLGGEVRGSGDGVYFEAIDSEGRVVNTSGTRKGVTNILRKKLKKGKV